MDSARADILAARHQLQTRGWIPRKAEGFRHLPPPDAAVWLGDETAQSAPGCEAHPLAGAGWTLHPIGHSPQGRVDARWLDASDALQRAELWAGLSAPLGAGDARDADDRAEGDAAPFSWAHRALCRHGLRLRIGGTPGAERGPREPVWLQLRHQPRRAVEAPMLVIEVLAGVHCVLVETHDRQSVAASNRSCRTCRPTSCWATARRCSTCASPRRVLQTASRTTCTPRSAAMRTTHRRWSLRAAATTCNAT
jgi:Fe-S cluster assembly protein SufD